MQSSLSDVQKSIIITGSSSGIGANISKYFCAKNWQVIGLARHHEKLGSMPANYKPLKIDFLSKNNFKQIAKEISTPDLLVLNAGFGYFKEFEQFSEKQIREMFEVNFFSQIFLLRSLLPEMKKRGQGKVVFIGSDAAFKGGRKGSIYCASKFALRGFCQSIRDECSKSGILVSSINPGMVKTSFFDDLSYEPGHEKENYISPEQITKALELILDCEDGTIIDEINISPQKKVVFHKK